MKVPVAVLSVLLCFAANSIVGRHIYLGEDQNHRVFCTSFAFLLDSPSTFWAVAAIWAVLLVAVQVLHIKGNCVRTAVSGCL